MPPATDTRADISVFTWCCIAAANTTRHRRESTDGAAVDDGTTGSGKITVHGARGRHRIALPWIYSIEAAARAGACQTLEASFCPS